VDRQRLEAVRMSMIPRRSTVSGEALGQHEPPQRR
jgi:hypothetical protein